MTAARIIATAPVDLWQRVGALEQALRNVYAEFTGVGMKPQAGCAFFCATAGDATILLEYEYQPGEEPVYNLDSPMCGPGYGETVSIIQALVNGRWCVPEDVFAESLIERWAEQIAESEAESAVSQREDYDRDRYDDARDFAEAA